MFKKSFLLVLTILGIVFLSGLASQMVISSQLPSAYDPGISIDQAFKTSKQPLLIEFYSDTCTACRVVTPVIHEVYNARYTDRMTFVMLNIDDPDVYAVSRIFGVEKIPSVYLFNVKHMKKREIPLSDLASPPQLTQALEKAFLETQKKRLQPLERQRKPSGAKRSAAT